MKQTKVTFNIDGLKELRRAVGGTLMTRVGVLGSKNARDGEMGNADIGLVHEFGSEAAGIPPRSFLRMPLETHRAELLKGMSTKAVQDAMDSGQYRKVFQILGVKAEEIVQQAFSTAGFGKWPKLKPSTIDAKGSAAPLIDTGQLRRAVTSDVVNRAEVR
jgi:hypothetical protein